MEDDTGRNGAVTENREGRLHRALGSPRGCSVLNTYANTRAPVVFSKA